MSERDDSALSPSGRYGRGVAAGEWQDDPAQRAALESLDRLWRELVDAPARGFWQRLRSRVEAPRGVYLHGPVGRGKTFVCDLFYEA
ncbi:MAG TPA: AFG1/ZapE family ATPase, partial [Rhodanobacteraceae bacterium]|nr:AFG1/ZapE family ATPase [Rhodanobacteraceae bacterium]